MNALTKDQVQKLSPEQQAELARIEAEHVRARHEIVNKARRDQGTDIPAGVVMGVAGGLAIYSTVEPKAFQFVWIAVIALVGHYAGKINRRLDALMELLDKDAEIKQRASQEVAPPNGGAAASAGGLGVTGVTKNSRQNA
jgi:phage shock protein PspC (stress-responsive transcriptional regulator)